MVGKYTAVQMVHGAVSMDRPWVELRGLNWLCVLRREGGEINNWSTACVLLGDGKALG